MKVSQLCGKEISLNKHPFIHNDFVGVEIELENVDSGWLHGLHGCRLEREGSVRNGFEIVTEVLPASKLQFILRNVMHQIQDFMHEYEMEEEDVFGERTSIHIHLNMSDCDVEDVQRLMVVYKAFEPMIMNYHGDRQHSRFCTPLYANANRYTSTTIPIHRQGSKYMAVNTRALQRFGTLEFRHMAGTSRYEVIEEWVAIILALKHIALNHNWNTLRNAVVSGEIFNEMPMTLLHALGMDSYLMAKGQAFASLEFEEARHVTAPVTNEVVSEAEDAVETIRSMFRGVGYANVHHN